MIHWVLIAMLCHAAAMAPIQATYFATRDLCLAAEAKVVSDGAAGGYEVLTHQCALVRAEGDR